MLMNMITTKTYTAENQERTPTPLGGVPIVHLPPTMSELAQPNQLT